MKNLRLNLSFIVIQLFCLSTRAFVVDGLYYNVISSSSMTVKISSKSSSCIGDIIIPETVTYGNKTYTITSIATNAFKNCSDITSIALPSSLLTIGDYAFDGCSSISSITIPKNVISIGYQAFANCDNLTDLVYGAKECTIEWPSSGSISTGESVGWNHLINVTIGKDVLKLGEYIFSECTKLSNVKFEDNSKLNAIDNSVFYDCHSLENIVLPNTITEIDNSAFYNCISLKEMLLPNSLTKLGSSVFYGCKSLAKVNIPNQLTSIPDAIFSGCTDLVEIVIDSDNPNYTSIDGVLYNKDVSELLLCPAGISQITIPSTVISLNNYCFSGCNKLSNIEISSNVNKLGNYCFCNCTNLTSIQIPTSVTSLGYGCFYGCTNLKSIMFSPDNSIKLGYFYDMFNGCTSLESLDLSSLDSNEMYQIGNLFKDCKNLKKIDLTNFNTENTSYGFESAFQNDKNIEAIYSRTYTPSNIKHYTFTLLPTINTAILYVPEKAIGTYANATGWNKFTNIRAIPEHDDYSIKSDAIFMSDTKLHPGETIELPIYLNNSTDILAYEFYICLPKGVSIEMDNGNYSISISKERITQIDETTYSHALKISQDGYSNYRVISTFEKSIPLTGNNGKIAKIKLKVSENMNTGIYDINLKNMSFLNTYHRRIAIDNTTCTINVDNYQLGDIDNSGVVDKADITALASYIAQNKTNLLSMQVADLNNDKSINIADVAELISMLLSK